MELQVHGKWQSRRMSAGFEIYLNPEPRTSWKAGKGPVGWLGGYEQPIWPQALSGGCFNNLTHLDINVTSPWFLSTYILLNIWAGPVIQAFPSEGARVIHKNLRELRPRAARRRLTWRGRPEHLPTSWQDEALARHGVSSEVPCSALKGETVPDSLPATPKSPPTRRVPPDRKSTRLNSSHL